MILVWVTAIGVASAVLSTTRLRRLAELPVRHLWLVWVALGVQLVLFEFLGRRIPVSVSDKVHIATYALALIFLWLNRRLPAGWLISVGAAFNLLAIVANDGAMPASMVAWRKAGLRDIPPDVFENSRALSSPRLAFLGDVFYVPESWPLSNVFSIGDVLIVVGSTYLAHRWCSQPRGRELEAVVQESSIDVSTIEESGIEGSLVSAGSNELV
jgi:hypothetical protein